MSAPSRLFLDFECEYDSVRTIKKMTLRQYLAAAPVIGCAVAEDDEAPVWFSADSTDWPGFVEELARRAADPSTVFVAHNAAFDIRVQRFGWTRKYGPISVPQPHRVHCSLEMSMAAFPCQPGGYALASLARTLNLGMEKLKMPWHGAPQADWDRYCCGDVELCRRVYRMSYPRLHADEVRVAELANAARELYFEVSDTAVSAAMTDFSTVAGESVAAAVATLGEGGEQAYGFDGEVVRSVKPQTLKKMLVESLGFSTQSISFKKINPEKLRQAPDAAKVLKDTERANKALSHKRRVRVFSNVETVDAELGYYRAHTGRFSSPSVGKGLNLHNIPKRDKRLAKVIRTMFRLPDGLVAVRGDLANVEYRGECWLTDCEHGFRLFDANPFADPYLGFGNNATGRTFTRADAIRQAFKAAVLGYGYLMGLPRAIEEMLKTLADPANGVSEADLAAVVAAQGWLPPKKPFFTAAVTKTRAPLTVATAVYHLRDRFHAIHPEFKRLAIWLERLANMSLGTLEPQRLLDEMYTVVGAPDPNKILVTWDTSFGPDVKTLRVRCGSWGAPTITWRDLQMAVTPNGGACLHAMHEKKGLRPLTANLLIENVVQSWARNALCAGQLELERRGFPYQLSVHDEIMLIVPQEPKAILAAKQALVDVFGPGNKLGYDWAVLIDPKEINVSKTLYEIDMNKLMPEWWEKLAAGDPKTLEVLP
jgi:hypothetical protein